MTASGDVLSRTVSEPDTPRIPVTHETCGTVTGPFLHGTSARLEPGEEFVAGRRSNFETGRVMNHVYFTTRVETAAWGAQLAAALAGGTGPGHVYVVVPTGPFEDDPNVTDKRFPGNPTESYRSREPLRVVEELLDWPRHPAEALAAMLAGLETLRAEGRAVIYD